MNDFDEVQRGAGLTLADAARGWLGTPYQHAQRTRGVAVDCVNLVLGAAEEAGLFDWAEWDGPRQYSPWVNAAQLQVQIDRLLQELPANAELWPGDVLLLTVGGAAQHVGVYAELAGRGRVVHASLTDGCVVEHDYERFWRARTVRCYRWRIPWRCELGVDRG